MGFGPGGDLQRAFLSLDDFVKRLAVAAFYFMHKEIVMISFQIITQKPKTAIKAPKASSGEPFLVPYIFYSPQA